MANNERMAGVLDLVGQAHARGEHDQGSWGTKTSCGTTMCFAGWAAVHSGLPLKWRRDDIFESDPDKYFLEKVETPEGEQRVRTFAADYLGLSSVQTVYLFSSENTYEETVRLAKEIMEGVFPPAD